MIWYLLLLCHVHSTKANDATDSRTPFQGLPLDNRELCSNANLPDFAVNRIDQALNDEGSANDCRLTVSLSSQTVGCSTRNSGQSSRNAPFFDLNYPYTIECDTVYPDFIKDCVIQGSFLHKTEPNSVSFPLATGPMASISQPDSQFTCFSRSQPGACSTRNSDKYIHNVEYFLDNNTGFNNDLQDSKEREVVQEFPDNDSGFADDPTDTKKREGVQPLKHFSNWPRISFPHSFNCQLVSKDALIGLESYVNRVRNYPTPFKSKRAVKIAVVIAIGNRLETLDDCLPGNQIILKPETLQKAKIILGKVHKNKFETNLMKCFQFGRLSQSLQNRVASQQRTNLKNEFPNFKNAFSDWVAEKLSMMSIVFRSVISDIYHHPVLALFWNASVELLAMHGVNQMDYMECLKTHIMVKISNRHSKNKSKLIWDRNEDVSNCLHEYLSVVLSLIADTSEANCGNEIKRKRVSKFVFSRSKKIKVK
uniref:Uncharacterized protein n=1 Tax=Spongospora subterranea TaxID=70186 RepID=A0A0H5REH8_9EUKA|eukprot:CRZ06979.1 hypothetical protein [Spongospora subterranea]